ncbi:hypothetical protein Vi05172_g12602 [Venturia inaequalis]|uniref:DDHD domain-containing protein n=1 Tax=Venturia inaequalis TaxID=5025 RepID=A0A8H3VML6_VENIN|nr:hypothetical protein EG327_001732 [Venturia inaequalis]RDI77411.1 hypothetical protein Vi05172_g12602 [Venturia inaequalis]
MSGGEDNKSYLSGMSFSPWGSRSATPKPPLAKDGDSKREESGIGSQRGKDYKISNRYRLSLRNYPRDCPPLQVQWYHAVDIPKRKMVTSPVPHEADKPAVVAKKYVPFSNGDSKAIETTYQKLSEKEEATDRTSLTRGDQESDDVGIAGDSLGTKYRRSGNEADKAFHVPVNEDYLFDVDVERRELAPAYWLGPVYDVRRGTWFFQEGATLRPCDENLATQLEEGFLKLKAWKFPKANAAPATSHQRSGSQPRSRPASMRLADDPTRDSKSGSGVLTPKGSTESLKTASKTQSPKDQEPEILTPEATQRTFRLFGAHMNSVVTYQDENNAWIVTDDFLSRIGSTVYGRFAGGAHYVGTKVVRGYSEQAKKPPAKDDKNPLNASPKVPESGSSEKDSEDHADHEMLDSPAETRRKTLERQISTLVESVNPADREKEEEEVRRRQEKEMEDDYKDQDDEEQGREIEHLVLVTHGIGQRLGLRLESVNFVHDVNTLRKTLKGVYSGSADLQALNGDLEKDTKNSRVQVLPICWRHLLDFPRQSLKHNRKEHDLGDTEFEDENYPSLEDITVDGVPAVRNLITDLALDILLYQSPAYKGHITRIVLDELNRIYRLFKQRNPGFNGKISLAGHSLGSAIMFDILCNQKMERSGTRSSKTQPRQENPRIQLEFEVEDFYALGSPIGLFQMLKGRTIAARQTPNVRPAQTPFDMMDDPFLGSSSLTGNTEEQGYLEITTSSPKCRRVFNIFHPTDPISYRLEPLISPAMATLKPQPLPYTKKGIFGAPNLTGLGARVGQSVTGFWSSFSSGIASSLLNRSLGISGDEAGKLSNPMPYQQNRATAAGTNIVAGGVVPSTLPHDSEQLARGNLSVAQGENGEHPPTLLDSEIETLFSGFQKRKRAQSAVSTDGSSGSKGKEELEDERREMEEQGKRLRREEGKVRALNSNGRVDYSIQEGAFDISLLASIASHLSYWADEDVSHFMISQLLSRHRVLRENNGKQRGDVRPGAPLRS